MDVMFMPTQDHHLRYMPPEAIPRMCQDTRGITAITPEGPVAICLLDTWTENSCQIHIWIGKPMVLRHGFLEEVFSFVFIQGERKSVIGITPSDNRKALRFNEHAGMKLVCRLPNIFSDGVDGIVTRMDRDECRWINGQQEKRRARL